MSSSTTTSTATTTTTSTTSTTPVNYRVLTEGTAKILCPTTGKQQVFYNPAQETNRDLSVAVIKVFQELYKSEKEQGILKTKFKKNQEKTEDNGISILEALSATGLRSIRYYKEIPGIKKIIVNDIDETAVAAIKKNLEYNNVPLDKVTPNHSDAVVLMHQVKKDTFDVVDLDPYGSPSIFLDSAVQAVTDGGLLCVTCTDMAVLCGNYPEVCFAKYGSLPLKGNYCHEMALRIVLNTIESHALRYKRYIVPMICLSIDFYIRVCVRVYTSAKETKKSLGKLAHIHQCIGCHSYHLQPLAKITVEEPHIKVALGKSPVVPENCVECNGHFKMGGPIWTPPIYNSTFLNKVVEEISKSETGYGSKNRLLGLLSVLQSELPDVVLFHTLPSLINVLHLPCPSLQMIRSAIMNAGYKISISHTEPQALKTNAPSTVIWDIMRAYAKELPAKNRSPNSPAAHILAKESKTQVDFTLRDEAKVSFSIPRFLPAPMDNWGPKPRAAGKKRDRFDQGPEEADNKKQKQ